MIQSLDGTVDYGENPELSADLAYKDALSCEEFETDDIIAKDGGTDLYVAIMPEKSSVMIRNENGDDVTSAYDIEVKREELKIIPRKITVTVQNASKIYDGTVLSFDGYELSEGTLPQGDSLFAYFTKSIVDIGTVENTPHLVLINKDGTDVTLCYDITVVAGMLTVEKRPLILTTPSGEFDYDGTPHVHDSCEISAETPLAQSQSLSVLWSGVTDAGDYKNIPTRVTVTSAEELDVTNNYSVFFEAGTLRINPLPITVATADRTIEYRGTEYSFKDSGLTITEGRILSWHGILADRSSSATDVGTYTNDTEVIIFDGDSQKDVTHNYNITYVRGTVEIKKRSILVITPTAVYTYDGAAHYNHNVTVNYSLASGDMIVVTEGTSVTDAGTYPNQISVKIVKTPEQQDNGNTLPEGKSGEDYVDVSHNYEISYLYGTLTVNKRPVLLKPVDAKKVYDDTPLMSSALQVSPNSENGLVNGHSVFDAQTSGSITNVGMVSNYIIPSTVEIHDAGGTDVTYNYEILSSVGLLAVTPREVLIQTGGASKKYDGSALTNNSFAVAKESQNELISGHIVSLETIGSISRVGKTENICNLEKTRIYDASGTDVTANYLVKYSYGMLEVYGDANGDQHGSGFNESGTIGSFRNELTSSADIATLLNVMDERDGYLYLRLKSFGGYAGGEWNEATEYSEKLLGQYSANYLASLAIGDNTKKLLINAQNPLFFMPYYTSPFDTAGHIGQTSDVIYNDGSDNEATYTFSYKDYDYGSSIILPAEYAEFEKAYRTFVYSQYLIMDDETRAYMESIIEEQGFFGNDMETILNVARYVQNCAKYNVDYDEALDAEANVAIAFLELYEEGISQHFATAATLLYRAMGIPARYTIGYATPTLKDEWVLVDRSNVHAWVEVYIDGVGWIEIEPTGGSSFGLNGSGGKSQKQTITVKPAYQYKIEDGTALQAASLIEYNELLDQLYSSGYRWSVKVSGSIDTVGKGESYATKFTLYDPYGADVTNQYNIVYENGTLEILASDAVVIWVELSRLQKYYDGTPLSFEKSDYKITSNASLENIEISMNVSLTDVGYLTLSELNENSEQYVTLKYGSATGDDLLQKRIVVIFTDHFTYTAGYTMSKPVIKIDRRPVTIVASSMSKLYDGTPLTSSTAYLSQGSLCVGHTLTVEVVGSIEYPGAEINELTRVVITNERGENVTHNYDITKVNGTLTVYR